MSKFVTLHWCHEAVAVLRSRSSVDRTIMTSKIQTVTITNGSAEGPIPKRTRLNKDPVISEIFQSLEYGPAPEAANGVNAWLDKHGRSFGHFINGQWVKPKGRKTYESKNPATGKWLRVECFM